ncbi:MAG: Asp-tRNA(Asn)/Glu-tRNA(Gln) amidotransferase subunit GatC [Finegoldia sp.]|nr:Asp-tRNA(Asn)/Glu-tRNA(Gln) amidotransferase subunit GatC [Finegoldia sp.]
MIDRDEVVRVYDLAHLALTDNVDELAEKYNKVLDFAKIIMDVDTEGVDPMELIPTEYALLREDEPEESIDREDALKNSKNREFGYFKLKRVVE